MKPNDSFKKSTSSFVTALYEAYVRADSGNSRRIEQAFPHFFEPDLVEVDFSQVELRLAATMKPGEMTYGEVARGVAMALTFDNIPNVPIDEVMGVYIGQHPVDAAVDAMKQFGVALEQIDPAVVDQLRAMTDTPMIEMKLLEKYMRHVKMCENDDFVDQVNEESDSVHFTPGDIEVLREVQATIKSETKEQS